MALLALVPKPVAAQEVVEIDDRIACPSCTIEVGTPVTLAPPKDHVWFASLPGPDIALDREGNYIATRIRGDALVAVFGPDGGYRSSYGRSGGGPGEFVSPPRRVEVGDDDRLHVISLRYLHTLAPRAERRLSQVRLSVLPNDAVVLKSGIAIQAPLRTESGITTIQILRPDAPTILASMGVAEEDDDRTPSEPIWNDLALRRRLARRTGCSGSQSSGLQRRSRRSSTHRSAWRSVSIPTLISIESCTPRLRCSIP